MKSMLSMIAIFLMCGLVSCGGESEGDASLHGRWYSVDRNQDVEFLSDGTFRAYEYRAETPSFEGTYEIEKNNLAVLTTKDDTMRIAYSVSDDGELLSYAFTHDVTGKPLNENHLHMIHLTSELPDPPEIEGDSAGDGPSGKAERPAAANPSGTAPTE